MNTARIEAVQKDALEYVGKRPVRMGYDALSVTKERGMRLDRSTWTQVRDYFRENDTVLIGVGSTECHGRHNPLGTDTAKHHSAQATVTQRIRTKSVLGFFI